MLDRKEMMKQMAFSPVVNLISVLKAHSYDKSAIICVFEGEDAKYYGSRIDSIISNKNRKNVTCKGKSNLLALKKTVDNNINLKNVDILFFSDRDYDFDDLTNDSIYFTPCHSVENFYVNEETFKKIICDEYGVCSVKDKETFENVIGLFNKVHEEFCEVTLELNSWIMCQVEMSKSDSSIELNLNNTKITDFVDINLDCVNRKYDIESLHSLFKRSTPVNYEKLDSAKGILINNGLSNSCRGKYIIQFFRIFLDKLNSEFIKKDSSIVQVNIKPKIILNDSNILSVLSQYARTPSCLNKYLLSHNHLALAS